MSVSNQSQMKSCSLGVMHTEIASVLWASVINFSIFSEYVWNARISQNLENFCLLMSPDHKYSKKYMKNICYLKMMGFFHLTYFTTLL